MKFFGYTLANSDHWYWFILLFTIVAGMYIFYDLKSGHSVKTSSLYNAEGSSAIQVFRHTPFVLRMGALFFMAIAFMRPQLPEDVDITRQQVSEGIDIVLAMDISGSMLAEDFRPNRLEAAKDVAIDFIKKRPFDRIGLVVYEGDAVTLCPMTTDHDFLIDRFKGAESGIIKDGTAIGMGLATAVNRLRESDAKSKVIILLSDGVNNQGNIDPKTAAEIAVEFGIRVYTIGIGKNGDAPFPMRDPFGRIQRVMMPVEIDEALMQNISEMTGGKYFRATDKQKLENIYAEIDQLEKSKVKVLEFREEPPEKFHAFAITAVVLLLSDLLFRKVFMKSLAW
ncbi:MAG: vWA domain-containing protein [Bacteroidota bacterium]